MSKRIWASLDDFLPPSDDLPYLGRTMANYYFLSALMKYGTFDEYHFFLTNTAHIGLFLKHHAPLFEQWGVRERITVTHRLALEEMAARHDYTVLHQSDHINLLNRLCRFRNRIGARFPVTGFIHSISYQQYMQSYLEMAMIGAGPKDALICSSQSGKRVLENCFDRIAANCPNGRGRIQMTVVPLGIDEADEQPSKPAARERLGLDPNEVIGLSFGRFSEVDKMDLFPLVQAFQKAGRSGPFRLVLSGSVHSRTYLKMLELWIEALGVGNKVTIFKAPTEETKRALFSAADFFVSTADNPQETFGLTILEAMWAGLPLIVSDFDGYRELVTPDVGIRVPTYWTTDRRLERAESLLDDRTFHLLASQSICVDVDRLTEALALMFRNASVRADMGKKSRRRFAEHFAHRRIIETLEGVWDTLKTDFNPALPETDWASLDTFNTFQHYVTGHLDDDKVVEITDFGRQILSQKAMHPLLPNMAQIIDNSMVVTMMRDATAPMTVSEFVSSASRHTSSPRYLLLWMLKHALLRIPN